MDTTPTTIGSVTLHHGDCIDVLSAMEAGSVDAVVTSPPYNHLVKRTPFKGMGMHHGNGWVAKVAAKGYADDMTEEDYRAWLRDVASACARVTRPGGSMFFNHKVRYRDGEMFHPLDYVREWEGWQVKQEIIWDRACGMAFNCGLFAPSDERVYWLVRPGAKPGWNDGAAGMLSVWRIPSNRHAKGSIKGHPCPFPVEIPMRCIQAVTLPGETVLDPFAGSGTTGVACVKAGRKCVLVEKDPKYAPVIEERLGEAEPTLFSRRGPSLFDLLPA